MEWERGRRILRSAGRSTRSLAAGGGTFITTILDLPFTFTGGRDSESSSS